MSSEEKSLQKKESVPCPICGRVYERDLIEKHVDKCIFLNSSSIKTDPTEKYAKRNGSHLDYSEASSSQQKKLKTEIQVCGVKKNESCSSNVSNNIPLAEQMRPLHLDDIVGQCESFGAGSMLHSMLLKKKIPNMILWGPPGCGKTSLANIIANICKEENNLRFVKLSATMSGINDVKEVVKVAKNEAQFKRQTVLFMDEIHRFNKLQQDTFLPHVENGTIILIGATTENPSFSLNNALLSRCRVVILSKLSVDDVSLILERAIKKNNLAEIVNCLDEQINMKNQIGICVVDRASIRWVGEICDGDARVALGALELALTALRPAPAQPAVFVSLDDWKKQIKRSLLLYDRKGEEHYNIISAVQKSIRASDDNAALYWTTRALAAGEDPLYVARRLIRTACEDIGLGDPHALVEAVACLQGCQHIGMPECDVLLAQCAVRLARAPKSHEVYHAMKRVQRSLSDAKGPLPPVPLHLRNAPTKLMKDLGYGKGYNTKHRDESNLTYMPEGLENINFFDDDSKT